MNRELYLARIVVVLIFIALVTSTFIWGSNQLNNEYCVAGSNDCSTVRNSEYSKLFGMPLDLLGVLFFGILGLWVLTVEINYVYYFWVTLGAAMASYFIYLQVGILKAICWLCMIVDLSMILITLFSYLYYLEVKKWKKPLTTNIRT
jgi:uncharacterized membrane protein